MKEDHVTIIAEAGVNHNGKLALALQLVDEAAGAGADFVKFQTFKPSLLIKAGTATAGYQKKAGAGDDQLAMLRKLELLPPDFSAIRDRCLKKGIGFLSSAFDLESIDLLCDLGMGIFKIPSGEISNKPYLQKVASVATEVILSTGMADMEDVKAAIRVFAASNFEMKQMTVLHCNSEYPTPFTDVNLKAMQTMKKELGLRVGYSDHTAGIEIPIAAVAMGASVIEKHFTLDRHMKGPDHGASLEPDELRTMVTAIRHIESALGDGIKKPTASELANKPFVCKSLFTNRRLEKGDVLTGEDLCAKRPGTGISPMEIDRVTGKRLIRDVAEGHLLSDDDFK